MQILNDALRVEGIDHLGDNTRMQLHRISSSAALNRHILC